MPTDYQHLTSEDRTIIYALLKEGYKGRAIATHIGKHHSAVYNEINRNKGLRGYRPKQAQEKAQERRSKASRKKPKMTSGIKRRIKQKLNEKWSPEQISGHMKANPSFWDGIVVSFQWIYQWIEKECKAGRRLNKNLRIRNGKKRRKKRGKPSKRGQIANRKDISKRPKEANERLECGHWEADLMSGGHHKGFLVTLVDRKSRVVRIGHVLFKTADSVAKEITRLLKDDVVKTITYDNGKEFSAHLAVNEALGCTSYFARPYHSQDRGTNENTNGLIRQYYPKGMDLRNVSKEELKRVEDEINSRPRKIHAYRTNEMIYSQRKIA